MFDAKPLNSLLFSVTHARGCMKPMYFAPCARVAGATGIRRQIALSH